MGLGVVVAAFVAFGAALLPLLGGGDATGGSGAALLPLLGAGAGLLEAARFLAAAPLTDLTGDGVAGLSGELSACVALVDLYGQARMQVASRYYIARVGDFTKKFRKR